MVPDMWLKHILIYNFDEYQKYYEQLPPRKQAILGNLISNDYGYDLFDMRQSARHQFIQSWSKATMQETKKGVEKCLSDVIVDKNNKLGTGRIIKSVVKPPTQGQTE